MPENIVYWEDVTEGQSIGSYSMEMTAVNFIKITFIDAQSESVSEHCLEMMSPQPECEKRNGKIRPKGLFGIFRKVMPTRHCLDDKLTFVSQIKHPGRQQNV